MPRANWTIPFPVIPFLLRFKSLKMTPSSWRYLLQNLDDHDDHLLWHCYHYLISAFASFKVDGSDLSIWLDASPELYESRPFGLAFPHGQTLQSGVTAKCSSKKGHLLCNIALQTVSIKVFDVTQRVKLSQEFKVFSIPIGMLDVQGLHSLGIHNEFLHDFALNFVNLDPS